MDDFDPHIHVDARLRSDVFARDLLSSAFGLVADLPPSVGTGCGRQVPRAMTSGRPERITCLPCRDYAHHRHLSLAEQLEALGRLPGTVLAPDDVTAAAAWHRDHARRFAG